MHTVDRTYGNRYSPHMKVAILAGGLGTRLAEETEIKPKPMVEIGGQPILWHIMKIYGHHGFDEFCIALGYKGEAIKRYFMDYFTMTGSLHLDMATGRVEARERNVEPWLVHLLETGHRSLTGGRILRMRETLAGGPFMLTYGDGVADLDINALVAFHRAQGRLATVTAVRPPARFGGLVFDGPLVSQFSEKPQIGEGWINGGYMVFEPGIFDYLAGDDTRLEQDVLERLAAEGQLAAYRHEGFWQCMDTLRDKMLLEELWKEGRAPWKLWA
ncbi:MAG: glucose-phosphate cytidylyltransferase [Cyanobacteria bacterium RYN_339]|nr:glucose-phosphate cytidylyltransferase [Cyanobacteria bacterium RYN_339]